MTVGAKRRASLFRFRSARWGKSFGIIADAEMLNVLLGVWLGSLASVDEYISGLTGGSRMIPFCPLGKSFGVGAVAEMAEGFSGVYIHSTIIDDGSAQKRFASVVRMRSSDGAMTGLLAGTRQTKCAGIVIGLDIVTVILDCHKPIEVLGSAVYQFIRIDEISEKMVEHNQSH